MKRTNRGLTRRDFLRGTAGVTMGVMAGVPTIARGATRAEERVRVVLVRDPNAMGQGDQPNGAVIQQMLDDGVRCLMETTDIHEAWGTLIRPDDVVGIKTNVWAYMPTPRAVEETIRRRVVEAGVPEERIRMDDRGARKTLSDCTALINARPLRTHHWAGIGGCLKNYIMFVSMPFQYHGDACASLGKVWTKPIVKGKTRLNILVALRPLFHGRGAHHYNRAYTWDYNGIFLSTDPVAVDAMGVQLLAAKRKAHFGEDTPFPKLTHHVTFADIRYHIGVSDPSRIDLVRVGWTEGILI